MVDRRYRHPVLVRLRLGHREKPDPLAQPARGSCSGGVRRLLRGPDRAYRESSSLGEHPRAGGLSSACGFVVPVPNTLLCTGVSGGAENEGRQADSR